MEDEQQAGGLIALDANGEFTCIECQNLTRPQVTGEAGPEDADLTIVRDELTTDPTASKYGYCGVCGMEYEFKLADGELQLLPSDEEK